MARINLIRAAKLLVCTFLVAFCCVPVGFLFAKEVGFCPAFLGGCHEIVRKYHKYHAIHGSEPTVSETESATQSSSDNLYPEEDNDALATMATKLVESDNPPFSLTGNDSLDIEIARGFAMMKMQHFDSAELHFTELGLSHPDSHLPAYGRGLVIAHKSRFDGDLNDALKDLSRALTIDPDFTPALEKRVEILGMLKRWKDAYREIQHVLEDKPTAYTFLLKGLLEYNSVNYSVAESSFRIAVQKDESERNVLSRIYLSMSLFKQQKYAESIEVNRETTKLFGPRTDVCLAIALAHRSTGDYTKAARQLDTCLAADGNNTLLLLHGAALHYAAGNSSRSLKHSLDCLALNSSLEPCLYYEGLVRGHLGDCFGAVRAFSSLIAYHLNEPGLEASFTIEFVKAQYLREYYRYLHFRLEEPLSSLSVERHFTTRFLLHWLNSSPGAPVEGPETQQNHIVPDIQPPGVPVWAELSAAQLEVVCAAKRLGETMQVSQDGVILNKRLSFAVGLAALHVGQILETYWKSGKKARKASGVGWRHVYEVAARYRHLADIDRPVLWQSDLDSNVTHTFPIMKFVSGGVKQMNLNAYVEDVITCIRNLMKQQKNKLHEKLQGVSTMDKFLEIMNAARPPQSSSLTLLSDIPSTRPNPKPPTFRSLAWNFYVDRDRKPGFAIGVSNAPQRTALFTAELDYIFTRLTDRATRLNTGKVTETDEVWGSMLTQVYFFCNLMPISHGGGDVGRAVLMGTAVSLGKVLHGSIMHGHTVCAEAQLAGDAMKFQIVMKEWFTLKPGKLASAYPSVADTYPRVGDVMSVMAILHTGIPSGKSVCSTQ